tara:strand:- start:437 stop:595 length:159 start_codon:yes stop_codon:yes gene_type:complete
LIALSRFSNNTFSDKTFDIGNIGYKILDKEKFVQEIKEKTLYQNQIRRARYG